MGIRTGIGSSYFSNLIFTLGGSDSGGSGGDTDGPIFPRPVVFVLGQGTPVTVGNNKTNELVVECDGIISKAYVTAKTGPVGSNLIFDINLNGTSIWNSNQNNRISIADGQTYGAQTSFDTTAVSAGDLLSIDVDQVGSVTPGQEVTVQLLLLIKNQ